MCEVAENVEASAINPLPQNTDLVFLEMLVLFHV